MKTLRLVTNWETSLRIIMLLSVCLCLSILITGALTLKLYRHRERVVIVPPLALMDSERIEVAWNTANQDYLKSFALYVSTLIGNITPDNIQFVADVIGDFVTPAIYGDIRTKLLSLAKDETWVTSAQASFFAPRQIVYEPQTERVFVIGDLITTGFKTLSERKNVIYEMIVKLREGRPIVEYFTSYEGNQPHTLKWILSQTEEVKVQYGWLLEKASKLEKTLKGRKNSDQSISSGRQGRQTQSGQRGKGAGEEQKN